MQHKHLGIPHSGSESVALSAEPRAHHISLRHYTSASIFTKPSGSVEISTSFLPFHYHQELLYYNFLLSYR